MVLLILAAGFSTRLEPRTLNTPKHLLPIGSKVFIDYFMESIRGMQSEIERSVLVTNQRYYDKFKAWAKGKNIEVISDGVTDKEHRIGTIGDFLFTIEKSKIKGDVMVCAADFVLEKFDFKKFIDIAKKSKYSFTITKHESDMDEIKAGSCLLLGADNRVTKFEEKPKDPFSDLYGAPYYFVKKEDIKFINKIPEGLRDNCGQIVAELVCDSKIFATRYNGNVMHMTTERDYQELVKTMTD